VDAVDPFFAAVVISGGVQAVCQLTSYYFELSRVRVNQPAMKHYENHSSQPGLLGLVFGSSHCMKRLVKVAACPTTELKFGFCVEYF
jgi:hypothetical protein